MLSFRLSRSHEPRTLFSSRFIVVRQIIPRVLQPPNMEHPPTYGIQNRLVRSFTDELQDRNLLEKSTKYAQKHHDAEHERSRNARLEAYFEDTERTSKCVKRDIFLFFRRCWTNYRKVL